MVSDMSWKPEIAGQEVRVKGNPSYRGITTGKTRVSGTRLLVQVQFAPNEKSYKPYNLLELCGESEELFDLFQQRKFSGADDLRKILTFEKLKGQLTNIFYSMESSKTDFYPHQFKPVLKFLESPVGRLLVADEVGLGKTIEAMYVWKELQARTDARRLLILCPAILREKWQDDLRQRFNIVARLTSAQELLEEAKYVLQSQYQHPFVCIASLEGMRPGANWEDESNTSARAELARLLDQNPVADDVGLFDLVVIDEAHYLRNQSTATHRLGQLVRDASRHLLLLTATPIQTESANLYQLLKIISPEDFFDETVFHQMQAANAPLIRALRSLWSHPPDLSTARHELDRALQSEYFRENQVLQQIKTLLRTPETISTEMQVRLGYKLESASLISQYLTRSRKRDVIPNRVERASQTLCVPFSDREKQIYESVTQAIRKQSKGKQGVPLFRLIAYQRQMASCLVAALQSWSEQGILDEMQADELFWEDLGIAPELQSQIQEPLDPIVQLAEIDYKHLEAEDTKYRTLVDFLCGELQKNPQEQFVLFAYFRGTLRYIQRRLEEDGIQTILILGGMGDRKWEAIQQFEQGKASILLSSEVGSEGIDLQFCRFLINYDLPWNPMRVEQRIGRLDRLGQKADRISIINFSLVDTIEERILTRLYDRINVFRESIGDLENILGEATEKLLVTLFNSELTDDERLQRAEQTASAILKQSVEQERLEQEAVNLIAFSDHILNAVTKSRDQGRWVTAEELYSFVEDYFARYYEGTTIKPVLQREAVFEIRLSEDAKLDLEWFLKQHRVATQTRLHRSPVLCLFDPRVEVASKADKGNLIELLDPTHPLIQWIRHSYETDAQKLHPIAAVCCQQLEVGLVPGHYIYVIHRWLFKGLRSESRLAYKVACCSTKQLLSDERSEQFVYRAARYGKAKLNAANLLTDSDLILALYNDCQDALEEAFEQASQEFDAENDNRCRVQERSAESYAQQRCQQLEERIQQFQQSGRLRMLPATEGLLKKVNRELETKRRLIEERRNTELKLVELAAGIVFVQ